MKRYSEKDIVTHISYDGKTSVEAFNLTVEDMKSTKGIAVWETATHVFRETEEGLKVKRKEEEEE